MTISDYQLVSNGDAAISIIFNDPISEKLSTKIIQLSEHIKITIGDKLNNVIPGYQSLTLCTAQPSSFIESEF